MKIKIIPVGLYEANCCLVWQDPRQAWVIDPGAEAPALLDGFKRNGLSCGVIVLTHGHFDHLSALPGLLAAFPDTPVYLHERDASIAFSPFNAVPPDYPPTSRPESLRTDKGDGDTLTFGGLTATFLHTPGHTPGSCCLLFPHEKTLFSGDTLFAGSIGRTDFPGGSQREMARSLQKLKSLPDDLRVICGHGPETTLREEKQHNPYLAAGSSF